MFCSLTYNFAYFVFANTHLQQGSITYTLFLSEWEVEQKNSQSKMVTKNLHILYFLI